MIVLDTSVIAELVRPKPHKPLLEWLDAQDAQQLFLTALSVAELFTGIEALAEGPQKNQISTLLLETLNQDFAGRLLAFDAHSALIYARLFAENQHAPAPLNQTDLQNVAICQQHQARLATQDLARFASTGLSLINPWENRGSPRWREDSAEYFIMSRKS
ncbi:type II toxin-antitoxin system VapC family toxin [Rouxiella chamberiensis]|uniref:type II toxin-antitoxin system VapC family toxin n=1 Tax=Rouxiella chamberiensis TaxID=1513468 RepID=UPI0005D3ABAE|nr:type II toxin-antitoxin system VapC family toxin [Rouxiella chamberiensis]